MEQLPIRKSVPDRNIRENDGNAKKNRENRNKKVNKGGKKIAEASKAKISDRV